MLDLMAGFTIGKTFKAKTDHDTRPYGLIESGTIRTSIGGIGTGTDLGRTTLVWRSAEGRLWRERSAVSKG